MSVCNRDAPPAPGWVPVRNGKTHDANGKPYYLKINNKDNKIVEPKKAQRIAQTRYFNYPGRDGNRLIRVKRIDYPEGTVDPKTGKPKTKDIFQERWSQIAWVNGVKPIQREDIPIYRYKEIQEAIAKGETIWVVEGETTADALWELGLAATTNLGGSGKWRESDTKDLEGAVKIILCPDRDKPGLKHMDAIASQMEGENIQWCYPFTLGLWNDVPDKNGVDLGDYIADGHTKKNIFDCVYDERIGTCDTRQLNHDTTLEELIKLHEKQLDSAETLTELKKLQARTPVYDSRELQQLYKALSEDIDKKVNEEEAFVRLNELVELSNSKLDLKEVLPRSVAEEIEKKADNLRARPERFLGYYFAGLSATLGSKIFINGKRNDKWEEFPRIYYCDVAPPSNAKSQVINACLKYLNDKQKKENARYKRAQEDLKLVEKLWDELDEDEQVERRHSEDNPSIYKEKNCYLRSHVFHNGTIEATLTEMGKHPEDKGFCLVKDELSSYFNSQNQYKSGKGADRQYYLQMWNGRNEWNVLYATKEHIMLTGQTFNLVGGIQPHILKNHLDIKNDPDGMASRFLFCQSEPDTEIKFTDRAQDIDLFTKVFEQADAVTCNKDENGFIIPKGFEFDTHGYIEWIGVWKYLTKLMNRYAYLNPGLSAYCGKLRSYYLVFCLLLHYSKWVYEPENCLDEFTVDKDTAQKAFKVLQFYLGQFMGIQETTEALRHNTLDGIYHEVYKVLKQNGKITTREIYTSYRRKIDGRKMNAKFAMEILEYLAERGYGTIERKTLHWKEPPKKELSGDTLQSQVKEIEEETISVGSRLETDISVSQQEELIGSIYQVNTATVVEEVRTGEKIRLEADRDIFVITKILSESEAIGVIFDEIARRVTKVFAIPINRTEKVFEFPPQGGTWHQPSNREHYCYKPPE
ncbi:DUF3987 domain-containing protein [Crocosphaera sp.]|uniref:DUF3987 domain-containing protein n=1 Tax=Crocosphaera sp. TaxID=2729996 RepID=UPI002604537A|nr:DUF3987 domain-containing protein [Crocosphaera sp.]MDJ0579109.1 DUF3987 domain-containing protein [Crocosphaera sp.]